MWVRQVFQEKMFDLLNNRQSVPVPGASVRASSSRPDNETITYDSNGKWQPPQKWLGTKVLPGSSTGTAKEVPWSSRNGLRPRQGWWLESKSESKRS